MRLEVDGFFTSNYNDETYIKKKGVKLINTTKKRVKSLLSIDD